MAFLDWIKRRKEGAVIEALAQKYRHDAIGTPGAAARRYQRLLDAQSEKGGESKKDNQKTKPRAQPSWER